MTHPRNKADPWLTAFVLIMIAVPIALALLNRYGPKGWGFN